MNGAPKPVVTGRKGNVGGMMTPGRHGNHKAAMEAGVKNLIAPGPGMTKKVVVGNQHGHDDGKVKIDAGNLKKATGMKMTVAGSPKDISMGSGHKGIHVGTRPEPAIKRDSAKVVKPQPVVK